MHLASAIEHNLFNVPLCTDKTARLHRMKWFVRLGKAQMEHVSPVHMRRGIGTKRQIKDMKPADHRSASGEEHGHDSLSVHELLALHDPTFLDMYEWLSSSTKNNSSSQHYPLTLSPPTAESLHNDTPTAVEEKPEDDDIPETVATRRLEKQSPSPIMSEHDPSKDEGRYNPQLLSSPIAEVSNNLIDIAAVAKTDVDTPNIIPSSNVSQQGSLKQLQVSMASKDSVDCEDFMDCEDSMANEDFINKLGPVGISRSATSSRKLKARMRAGTYTINKSRQNTFESECLLSDPHTEFRYGEVWQVFHSRCGNWFRMTEAYNSTRFRQHIKKCKMMGGGSKFTTLNSFFTKQPLVAKQTPKKMVDCDIVMVDVAPQTAEYPCLGITASHDQRVSTFIMRTGAEGGGARSVTKIANTLFNMTYGELSERRKSQVDAAQMHEWTFRFDRLRMAIHSSKCNKLVSAPQGDDGPHTCNQCLTMYKSDKRLKSGLQKPMPKAENFKYLNEQYQGKSTAERYAKTQGLLELIQDKVCFLQ